MSLADIEPIRPFPIPPRQRARLRKAFGVTQAQLAAEMGVSRKTIHEWETGKGRPSKDHWEAYLALLTTWKRKLGK